MRGRASNRRGKTGPLARRNPKGRAKKRSTHSSYVAGFEPTIPRRTAVLQTAAFAFSPHSKLRCSVGSHRQSEPPGRFSPHSHAVPALVMHLMPSKPKKPCGHSGCAALVNSGRCDKHQTQHQRDTQRWRGTAASRGYGYQHQQERERHLRDHPLCVRCLIAERVTAATVLDHIVPVRVAPERQHDPTNHQGLCVDCHALKTAEDQRNYPQAY
jgi:5-methylcytosine-specific restriction enzyme A